MSAQRRSPTTKRFWYTIKQSDRATRSAKILSTAAAELYKNRIIVKACNMNDLERLKVTQGHRKWRDSIGDISLPISGLYLAPFQI